MSWVSSLSRWKPSKMNPNLRFCRENFEWTYLHEGEHLSLKEAIQLGLYEPGPPNPAPQRGGPAIVRSYHECPTCGHRTFGD